MGSECLSVAPQFEQKRNLTRRANLSSIDPVHRNLATSAPISSSFAPQNWVVPSPSARGQVEYKAMTIPVPGATQIVWP